MERLGGSGRVSELLKASQSNPGHPGVFQSILQRSKASQSFGLGVRLSLPHNVGLSVRLTLPHNVGLSVSLTIPHNVALSVSLTLPHNVG